MTISHACKIPRSDQLVFAGILFFLAAVSLTAHQFGYIPIAEKELEIERFVTQNNGSFRLDIDPETKISLCAVKVSHNGTPLKFNPSVDLAGGKNDTFTRVKNHIIAAPVRQSSEQTEQAEPVFKATQPIPIPVWIIASFAITGLVALNVSAVMAFGAPIKIVLSLKSLSTVAFAACFLVGWLGTAHIIRELDFQWDCTEFTAKVELCDQNAKGSMPDSIFVGSSRTSRQVNPKIFDEILSKYGYDQVSYNFGQGGRRALELPSVLKRIFRKDTNNDIQFVFVQLERVGWEYHDSNLASKPTVRSHNPATLFAICKYYFTDDTLPWHSRLQLAVRRLSSFSRWQNNYGFTSDWLKRWVKKDERNKFVKMRIAKFENGFLPMDKVDSKALRANNRQFKNLISRQATDEYLPQIRSYGSLYRHPKTEATLTLIREIIDLVENHGATPVFVEPPPTQNESVLLAYEQGIIENLIQLNDFSTNPEFYRHEIYFDRTHLNEVGTTEYSKVLAEQFAMQIQHNRTARQSLSKEEQR